METVITEKPPLLTQEEKRFCLGPLKQLCVLLSDFQINHEKCHIPEHVMTFIRANGFFGMNVPKMHGGLGFSAWAQSEVIAKVASVSSVVARMIASPNAVSTSLLKALGTDDQKKYYLERIAKGEELPCYLSGERAQARVCQADFAGQIELCVRLNWRESAAMLSPVATVLVVGCHLQDPDRLFSDRADLGQVFSIIPAKTVGVKLGRVHRVMSTALPLGTCVGQDVLIPLDWVIGGRDAIGCQSVSLPHYSQLHELSIATAMTQKMLFTSSVQMHGQTHKESLAAISNMAFSAYVCDAMRQYLAVSIDEGRDLSGVSDSLSLVVSLTHDSIVAAMHLHQWYGVLLGPSHYVAQAYLDFPLLMQAVGLSYDSSLACKTVLSAMECYQKSHATQTLSAFHDWANQLMMDRFSSKKNTVISRLRRMFCRATHRLLSGKDIAELCIRPTEFRELLIKTVYRTNSPNNPIGWFDECLATIASCQALEKKVMDAYHADFLAGNDFETWVNEAVGRKLLSPEEGSELVSMHAMRERLRYLDDFDSETL